MHRSISGNTNSLFFILYICSLIQFQSIAQVKPKNYIEKDSAFLIGKVKILSKTTIQFERSKQSSEVINASEIIEFGLDGEVFESIIKDGSSQFFKRLVSGKIRLFQDDHDFFIVKGDTIVSLTKNNFIEQLSSAFPCAKFNKVTYTSTSLKGFFNQFNERGCNLNYSTFSRTGISIGLNKSAFTRVVKAYEFHSTTQAFQFSAFYDLPVYTPKNLYLTFELQAQYSTNGYYHDETNYTGYFESESIVFSNLSGLKWQVQGKHLLPYFKLGLVPSHALIIPKSELIETFRDRNDIEVSYSSLEKDNVFSLGYSGALGIEYVRRKMTLSLEGSHAKSSFSSNRSNIDWQSIGVSIRINFK